MARGVIALGERWRPLGWSAGSATAAALCSRSPFCGRLPSRAKTGEPPLALIGGQVIGEPDLALGGHLARGLHPAARRMVSSAANSPSTSLPIFYPFGGALAESRFRHARGAAARRAYTAGLRHDSGCCKATWRAWTIGHLVERWLAIALSADHRSLPGRHQGHWLCAEVALRHTPASRRRRACSPNTELVPGMTLAACEITTPTIAAADECLHPPSGWVHVRLWWQPTGAIEGDYRARVRVAERRGRVGRKPGPRRAIHCADSPRAAGRRAVSCATKSTST